MVKVWDEFNIQYFVIGDEVIEWNGRSLQGKSYQEVSEIIAESKQEANVELIVSRSMGSRRAAQASWRQSAASRGGTIRFIQKQKQKRSQKPKIKKTKNKLPPKKNQKSMKIAPILKELSSKKQT